MALGDGEFRGPLTIDSALLFSWPFDVLRFGIFYAPGFRRPFILSYRVAGCPLNRAIIRHFKISVPFLEYGVTI